jgi:hypothetical protein
MQQRARGLAPHMEHFYVDCGISSAAVREGSRVEQPPVAIVKPPPLDIDHGPIASTV